MVQVSLRTKDVAEASLTTVGLESGPLFRPLSKGGQVGAAALVSGRWSFTLQR